MRNLAHFAIGNVVKKLNAISVTINNEHCRHFPKPDCFLLCHYRYQRRYIKIDPSGRTFGGLSRMVCSLIDFSLIRSIVAHKYSLRGFAYDPVSLFLAELFSYPEKFPNLNAFADLRQNPVRGRHYRNYASINERNIPCQATLTNFKQRLGQNLYNRIFHVHDRPYRSRRRQN